MKRNEVLLREGRTIHPPAHPGPHLQERKIDYLNQNHLLFPRGARVHLRLQGRLPPLPQRRTHHLGSSHLVISQSRTIIRKARTLLRLPKNVSSPGKEQRSNRPSACNLLGMPTVFLVNSRSCLYCNTAFRCEAPAPLSISWRCDDLCCLPAGWDVSTHGRRQWCRSFQDLLLNRMPYMGRMTSPKDESPAHQRDDINSGRDDGALQWRRTGSVFGLGGSWLGRWGYDVALLLGTWLMRLFHVLSFSQFLPSLPTCFLFFYFQLKAGITQFLLLFQNTSIYD